LITTDGASCRVEGLWKLSNYCSKPGASLWKRSSGYRTSEIKD
jgi:hypothetical protein